MTTNQEKVIKRIFLSNYLIETKIQNLISNLSPEQQNLKRELEKIISINNDSELKIQNEFGISLTKKEKEKLIEVLEIWG